MSKNNQVYITTNNPYWNRVTEIANKQRAKGINKYNMRLEENKADSIARINHIEEELIDALMYLEWLKESINE